MDFDNLRREAERRVGKDLVDRAETTLRKKVERKDKIDHIVDVKDVKFDREVEEIATEAKSRLGSDYSENSPIPPIERETSKSAAVDAHTSTQVAPSDQESETVSKQSHSASIVGAAIEQEYRYARWGLGLGLSCILTGLVLGLNGVAGSTSWTASVLGLESQINDAAPGVVVFIVGIFMVWITKPKVKLHKLKG